MIFACKEDDGGDDVGKIRDKFSVEVCEPKERTDAFDRRGGLPVLNGRELGQIHVYISLADDHTQIFHGRSVERAFRDFKRKTMFSKTCEDATGTLMVQFEVVFGVYPQIVHIDLEPSLGDHVGKDVVHERLKCRRGVAEAKEHYGGFIESERGDECCLPLVFLPDTDVVIAPSDIKLGEQCGVFHIID